MDELSAHRALRARGPVVALLDEPAPASLRPPADPVGHLRRPRLLRALDRGLRGHVTVVSAPAGYGKSTLLAAWAARRRERGPTAWVSLDPGSSDPTHFWIAVSDALGAGGAVRGCPPTAAGVAESLERASAPVVLVLDDLHELEGTPAAAGLARLAAPPAGRAAARRGRARAHAVLARAAARRGTPDRARRRRPRVHRDRARRGARARRPGARRAGDAGALAADGGLAGRRPPQHRGAAPRDEPEPRGGAPLRRRPGDRRLPRRRGPRPPDGGRTARCCCGSRSRTRWGRSWRAR